MKKDNKKKVLHFIYGAGCGAAFSYLFLQMLIMLNPPLFWTLSILITGVSGYRWMAKDGLASFKFLALVLFIGIAYFILLLASCSFGSY